LIQGHFTSGAPGSTHPTARDGCHPRNGYAHDTGQKGDTPVDGHSIGNHPPVVRVAAHSLVSLQLAATGIQALKGVYQAESCLGCAEAAFAFYKDKICLLPLVLQSTREEEVKSAAESQRAESGAPYQGRWHEQKKCGNATEDGTSATGILQFLPK
jgi:hypothetical protein